MIKLATDLLLALMVVGAWVGCAGFTRLREPLDRVHCTAFINVAAGTPLVLAAFLNDGISIRACKMVLILGSSLLAGAAMSHAIGQALVHRGSTAGSGPQDGVPSGEQA